MYSTSHSINGMASNIVDGSGTINPAALNSAALLPTPPSVSAPETSPRGVKRSRSPEFYGDLSVGDDGRDDYDGDDKRRKRGRPPKTKGSLSESPVQQTQQPPQAQTPLQQPQPLPQQPALTTPTQTSPTKSTPSKTVVKALPTVRDHTTDQLNPEGDEYVPREYDEAGEKKVTQNGHPLDGREYRCRTFFVPNRGDKLFMLATECARVLGYRDSYLLFNKNRSLYKIIATQAEKDDLIAQEILPYSYRSRQIAIVTAKSMFRQFGSRLIVNGRRVRDDYWESKARKQGFTEEDLAGEKRPGGARARESAAAEAASAAQASLLGVHGEIVYSNPAGHMEHHPQPQTVQPGMGGPSPTSIAPLPMINLAPGEDLRLRDYGNIPRPRQAISGQPYQDRTHATPGVEVLNQATSTAEFNKLLNQQRGHRAKYMADFWKQIPETIPPNQPHPARQIPEDRNIPVQPLQGAQHVSQQGSSGMAGPSPQQMIQPPQRTPSQSLGPQVLPQQHQPSNPLAQSPMSNVSQPIRPDQMQARSPAPGIGSAAPPQGSPYPYSHQNTMWPPPQPQQSPIPHGLPQYSPHLSQHSPHHQPSPQPPQMHHPQGGPPMGGAPMQYPGMHSMAPNNYPGMGRGYYNPTQSPQQYMHQTSATQQSGMQGWAPPSHDPSGQSGWPSY